MAFDPVNALSKFIVLAMRQGGYLTDDTRAGSEELLAGFDQLGVPYIAARWGDTTRVISAGRNSTAGVLLPKDYLSNASPVINALFAGEPDEVLFGRPGKPTRSRSGEELRELSAALGVGLEGAAGAALGTAAASCWGQT